MHEIRILQTEAQKQSFKANGFEEYEFHANSSCCDTCQSFDGKHFKVEKMVVGENAPPLHPQCRCSTSAYEDSKEYEEWLDYLGKGETTEKWKKINKNLFTLQSNKILEKVDNNDTINFNRKAGNSGVFSELPERMTKKHIREIAKEYNIDLSGISLNIDFNEELLRIPYVGRADTEKIGLITFFPNAFRTREELIRTLYHEKVHVQQFKEYGVEYVQNNRDYFEELAYAAEDKYIEELKKAGVL